MRRYYQPGVLVLSGGEAAVETVLETVVEGSGCQVREHRFDISSDPLWIEDFGNSRPECECADHLHGCSRSGIGAATNGRVCVQLAAVMIA